MKVASSKTGLVLQGYFRLERFRGTANRPAVAQLHGPPPNPNLARPGPAAPRPQLLPAKLGATVAQSKPALSARAPRPELLPGMGPARLSGAPRAMQARSSAGVSATPVPAGRLRVIGQGRPIEPDLRHSIERFFGADFSTVTVHEGPAAPAMGALAFTLGEQLHFAPGLYDPSTPAGVELLGHELTHVVQQRDGRVANPYGQGVAIVQDPTLEAEADHMGQQLAAALWSRRRVGQPAMARGRAVAAPAPARVPSLPGAPRLATSRSAAPPAASGMAAARASTTARAASAKLALAATSTARSGWRGTGRPPRAPAAALRQVAQRMMNFVKGDVAFTPFTQESAHHGIELDRMIRVPNGLTVFQAPSGFLMDTSVFLVLRACAQTGSLRDAVKKIGESFAAVTMQSDGDEGWAYVEDSLRALTTGEICSMIGQAGTQVNEVALSPLDEHQPSQGPASLSELMEGKRGTLVCDHCREPLTDPSQRRGKRVFALVSIAELQQHETDCRAVLVTSAKNASEAFVHLLG